MRCRSLDLNNPLEFNSWFKCAEKALGLLRKNAKLIKLCRDGSLLPETAFAWMCSILILSRALLQPPCRSCGTPCNHRPHKYTCTFILCASGKISNCRGTGHCTLNKSTTKQWSEMGSKNLQKECRKNQSWPLYPRLQLQSILLLECHGLFSLFFLWTCPLRRGRIVWMHGRGHYPPSCISIRVTTTLATLAGWREQRGLKPAGHTESYQHTLVWERGRELLNGSLRLHCVQG